MRVWTLDYTIAIEAPKCLHLSGSERTSGRLAASTTQKVLVTNTIKKVYLSDGKNCSVMNKTHNLFYFLCNMNLYEDLHYIYCAFLYLSDANNANSYFYFILKDKWKTKFITLRTHQKSHLTIYLEIQKRMWKNVIHSIQERESNFEIVSWK